MIYYEFNIISIVHIIQYIYTYMHVFKYDIIGANRPFSLS